MKCIQLIGHVPIPQGHRVELVWYQEVVVQSRLFGGETTEVKELRDPVVTDLSTGIRYGALVHFVSPHGSIFGHSSGTINVKTHTLRADLTPVRTLRGTVRSCSVVALRDAFGQGYTEDVETQLEIEADEVRSENP